MKFELWQQGIIVKPVMTLNAQNEVHAWKVLKKAGIKNNSKLLELIRIDNYEY